MSTKVIGYKAPFDLFNGTIKRGTLYRPLASANTLYYCAVKDDGHVVDSGRTNLPKEIVESWEPVYEQLFKLWDWVYIDRAENGARGADGSIGQLTDEVSHNGLSDDFPDGVRVRIGTSVWTIGKDYYSVAMRLATKEEIEQAIKHEASIRGYRKGYTIDQRPAYGGSGSSYELDSSDISIDFGCDYFNVTCGSTGIFNSKFNKWATIDKNPKPHIVINGHAAKYFSYYVKFGCASIESKVFISLSKIDYGYSNRHITKVKIGDGEFTIDQIMQIATYFINKEKNETEGA